MSAPQKLLIHANVKGVTLIELLVTISLLAILMALAVPSFQGMIAASRLSSTTSDFLATLSQARSSAIRVGRRFTICKSVSGTQCVANGDWNQGWIMFEDTTRATGNATVDVDENISVVGGALPNGVVMNGNLAYISFASDGLPKLMTGGFLAGTIRICSTSSALADDKRARDLVLNSAGRVSVVKPSNVASTCPSP